MEQQKRHHSSADGTEEGGTKLYKEEEEEEEEGGNENGREEEEFPDTRRVVMRFSSTGQEVAGRIVYRENFGILAKAEEDGVNVKAGDRFWTKWCGALSPMVRIPIVEVVHAVKQ